MYRNRKYMVATTVLLITLALACIFIISHSKSVKSISIDSHNATTHVGESFIIHYTITASGYDNGETYNLLGWESSNENIAIIESVYENEFHGNKCFGFINIRSFSTGKCTITLTAGDQRTYVDLNVFCDPQISIYPQSNNCFLFTTYLPENTKLKVSLVGKDFYAEQESTVQNEASYPIRKNSFEASFENSDKEINGNYTLIITLCEFSSQTDAVKNAIGDDGKLLTGNQIIKTEVGKSIYVAQEYELPYKTELKKIQETPFKELTDQQKTAISQWLKHRFDYYYEKYNGYWIGEENGDREYIHTVVRNEGAERYNKTYNQMEEIWDDYILHIPKR